MPGTNIGVPAGQLELATDIRARYGNMLTAKAVGEVIGVKDHRCYERFTAGIRAYVINGRRKYAAADVAKKLWENMEEPI